MCKHGARVIRFGRICICSKKENTSCFFVEPQMWELLSKIEEIAKEYEVEILPEIHEHYSIQMKIAEKGFLGI